MPNFEEADRAKKDDSSTLSYTPSEHAQTKPRNRRGRRPGGESGPKSGSGHPAIGEVEITPDMVDTISEREIQAKLKEVESKVAAQEKQEARNRAHREERAREKSAPHTPTPREKSDPGHNAPKAAPKKETRSGLLGKISSAFASVFGGDSATAPPPAKTQPAPEQTRSDDREGHGERSSRPPRKRKRSGNRSNRGGSGGGGGGGGNRGQNRSGSRGGEGDSSRPPSKKRRSRSRSGQNRGGSRQSGPPRKPRSEGGSHGGSRSDSSNSRD